MERIHFMDKEDIKKIINKLKVMREELGLSQEDWAQLIQVTSSTVARWERDEMQPTGAYKNRVKQVVNIAEDKKVIEALKATLASSGLPAAAGLMGMLFGVLTCFGSEHGLVTPLFQYKPSLFDGVLNFKKSLNIIDG
jgi:DNA-binding XRE family transcriptional regulator